MTNGSNSWDVGYGRITWLSGALHAHGNVVTVTRHHDIVFSVVRRKGCALEVLCLDEYVMGIAAVHRALLEFSGISILFVGGNWNSYTKQAKDFCLAQKLGLYNSSEISGALWRDEFWAYHKRDENGNPVYPFKAG